ncbi:copper uptake system-associated protein [Caballeronia sp. LZ033]|uniref:copper uptake system-associated protein n=1 Tax=Caballeronia sp. LZ033 TaxID=3038566 RepID=UPI00286585B1|nr:copper uptake system-associated protein [Caballeronia sp. LZ033]MDR5818763.1 copper uptake system-associated protein [Caballeronia sp. LZ033]
MMRHTINPVPRRNSARQTMLAAVLVQAMFCTHIAQASEDDVQQIRALLSRNYDRPQQKLEVAPVAVEQHVAIADWIQGEMGGRALLRKKDGAWTIAACGGDSMKDMQQLRDAGIPASTARALIEKLEQSERALDPKRVRKFDLFGARSGRI